MGKRIKRIISYIITALTGTLLFTASAFAATPVGHLDTVDATHVTGWVWNKDDSDEVISVELHIYADGNPQEVASVTVTADEWRDDLHTLLGDGYHSFQYSIDWSALKGTSFEVKAFAVSGDERIPLIGNSTYTKPAKTETTAVNVETKIETKTTTQTDFAASKDSQKGPGVENSASSATNSASGAKGASLGIFTTTGYCNCTKCSSGHNLTYSGTVPKAQHTISADLELLPLGTQVMIDNIIYTVEDMGSSVNGNKIDIYYATHSEAWAHGMIDKEVFRVE